MASKFEIGTEVIGSKGNGIIVKVITKSTGYVLVNYKGIEKKEMAFNLTDLLGNTLKATPKKQKDSVGTHAECQAHLRMSLSNEMGASYVSNSRRSLSDLANF